MSDRVQDAWEMEIAASSPEGNGGNGAPAAPQLRLAGARLAHFLEKIGSLRANLHKLGSRGYPAEAIKAALRLGIRDKTSLSDPAKLAAVAAALAEAGFTAVEVGRREEHGTGAIRFESRRDGVDRTLRIDWNLVTSAEYRALATNPMGLETLAADSFRVWKAGAAPADEPATPADAFAGVDEALEKLYAGAKKGLTVQRYKGLGEMNPTQLWETTMDPARRRLLQVRIEDDVEADSIFTILMGDEVEPRREFIQANALDVRNLDV